MSIRLGVNIDHVATIRKARGENHPDPFKIAKKAFDYGADSITIHLREDRRHINDKDLKLISSLKYIPLNLEMASNSEMLKIAIKYKPNFVCIVPEKRNEVTTEGGLNLKKNINKLNSTINILNKYNIRTSLFINPTLSDVKISKSINTNCIELHTGKFCKLKNNFEFKKLKNHPEISHLAVDEAIRWVSPVKHFLRYATEAYELRGKRINQGDALMMLYPSGNRDEEVFENADQFIADRRPNRHLAFGHGAHHCLGNLLAKMEMKHLYEELFSRVSSIELNGEPKLIQSTFVSGLKTLPVRVKTK